MSPKFNPKLHNEKQPLKFEDAFRFFGLTVLLLIKKDVFQKYFILFSELFQ